MSTRGDQRTVALEERLLAEARQARQSSYSPYSGFAVGAAILMGSGRVYRGTNVENSSYGLTCCAERVAIFTAIAAGERQIKAIAVVTDSPTVTPPCGACRQVIHEFGPLSWVVAANLSGSVRRWTLAELLPDAFGPDQLGRSRG